MFCRRGRFRGCGCGKKLTTDLAAVSAGLCDPDEERVCREEFGENLSWACRNCPKKRIEDLHDYTKKLLHIHALRRAGYPLSADDLTLEEWIDLGRLSACLQTSGPSK
jgi:hypothetical protein